MSVFDGFWSHLEKGKVVRRLTLFWMIWLTTETYLWTINYISSLGGLENVSASAALLIGAILGPVSTLQGFVFKFYVNSDTITFETDSAGNIKWTK